MKNVLIAIGAIVVLGGAYFFMTGDDKSQQVVYKDEVSTFNTDTTSFIVQYSEGGDYAKVTYAGKEYELERARSASGAKYASTDGSIVFWEHQGEATVEIEGETVIENATAAERRVEVLKSNKQGDPNAEAIDDDSDGDSVPTSQNEEADDVQ